VGRCGAVCHLVPAGIVQPAEGRSMNMGLKVKGGRRTDPAVPPCGCSEAGRRAQAQVASIDGIARLWRENKIVSRDAMDHIDDVLREGKPSWPKKSKK